jgi:hypothetical protein
MGESHRFMFTLHAPMTPGVYDEHYGVVQEGVAWFSDSGQGGPPDELLEVRVEVVPAIPDETDASVDADAIDASTDRDSGYITLPDGARVPITAGGCGCTVPRRTGGMRGFVWLVMLGVSSLHARTRSRHRRRRPSRELFRR